MRQDSLAIQNPYGVSVFGSALLSVSPDSALITATITRLEEKPSDSFSKTKETAGTVVEFLGRAGIDDFGMSRISLARESRAVAGEYRFLGYRAIIAFTIAVQPLDRLEEIVSGVIEAGASQISMRFQASNLKDLRMQARRLAVEAAKEKAAVYADAGGVSLGNVIHIQDVNDQVLQRQYASQFHVSGGHAPIVRERTEDEAGKQTLDPEAIEVGAAVLVAFSLQPARN